MHIKKVEQLDFRNNNLDVKMAEENKPLVTILTLVYNNSEYVLPALESIKAQLYKPFEHIIIDDCSSNNSPEVIQNWIDQNHHECKFIIHKKNKGICATLNEIILMAKGKYIFGASDDIMMPDKLVKDVELLEANPSYAFCASNMIFRDELTGNQTHRKFNDQTNLFYKLLNGTATIAAPTATYKVAALKEIGLFDENLLFEDYDMFLRLLSAYPCGYRDDYSVIYCVHPKSIQAQQEIKFHNEFFNILRKWKHLPNYWYYRNNRRQFDFAYFAEKNKKEALRHLLPALSIFWHVRLYKSLIRFILFWQKKQSS